MSTTGLQAASSQNAYRLWDRQRGQIEVMMHDFPMPYIAFRPIAPTQLRLHPISEHYSLPTSYDW